MNTEEMQAQTTAEENATEIETAEAGANAGTAAQTQTDTDAGIPKDSVNESAFEDSATDGTDKGSRGMDGNKKETQTKEQNAENARRRREAERQKEIRETRDKTIISTLRGKNPYTQEEMKDSADVEEFLAMREIEENGGDPVADYAKHLKQKGRDAAKKQEEALEKEEWFRNDFASFAAEHPDVKPDELISDKHFRAYADGKVGNMPLSKIYADFLDFVSEYDEKAMNKAAQMLANKNASPGSLQHTQEVDSDYFTPEQVRKMSQAEVSKNYDKIRKSMEKW